MDSSRRLQILAVAAAALGYFVDLYDIVIFGVVRVASLNDLGLTGADNTHWGIWLLNLQMIGMLIGGFFWGVVGDRMGRRFALIATIALYSLANLANAFVVTVEQYAVLRLLAGIGLAGELGAGVTLISELLPAKRRGYGATVIAVLGLCGALTASIIGAELPWRWAYGIGGGMGLLVLAMRIAVLRESAMFEERKAQGQTQGQMLLLRPDLLLRFVAVTAVGVPIWYASALFVNLAPEYGKALNLSAALTVAEVLRWQSVGLAIGSGISGLASEWMRSRRAVVLACISTMIVCTLGLMSLDGASPRTYCLVMAAMGLAQGYWTAFIVLAAEQFGTNLRATAATSLPNVVRAMTVPVTLSVSALWPLMGLVPATLAVGALVFSLSLLALWRLRETYGTDLDYVER
jgi:MFS transporter, putative metabolite:H+ symporter